MKEKNESSAKKQLIELKKTIAQDKKNAAKAKKEEAVAKKDAAKAKKAEAKAKKAEGRLKKAETKAKKAGEKAQALSGNKAVQGEQGEQEQAKGGKEGKKGKKKKLFLIIGLILVLGGAGFAVTSLGLIGGGSGPEGVVNAYFKAIEKFDLKKIQELMDPERQKEVEEAIALTEGEGGVGASLSEFVIEKNKDMVYSVIEAKEDGDTALVTVVCSYVEWDKAFKTVNDLAVGLAVEQLLTGKEVTGDQVPTLVSQILAPDTMTIEEPKAESESSGESSGTGEGEGEGEGGGESEKKLTKEEKEKLKEEEKKKAEEAKAAEAKLEAEKKVLEADLAVKVAKIKQELAFPLKQSNIEITCTKIDGKWYISKLSEESLNVCWSGIKSLLEEITASLGLMGIEPPQPETEEGGGGESKH